MQSYDEFFSTKSRDKSVYTINSYRLAVNRFIEYFKITEDAQIDKLEINDYLKYQNHLLDSGLSKSSVNTHFRYLSSFINWLKKYHYIKNAPEINSIDHLESPKKTIFYLTIDEQMKMINSIKKPSKKLMLVLMLETGVRQGELRGIKLSDISDLGVLVHRKENKEQILGLTNDVRLLLKEYLNSRTIVSEYLFCNSNGESLSAQAVGTWIERVATNAGIDPERVVKITPHTTRKSFACNMLNDGVPITTVQKVLGHTSVNTTQFFYAEVSDNTMNTAILNQRSLLR